MAVVAACSNESGRATQPARQEPSLPGQIPDAGVCPSPFPPVLTEGAAFGSVRPIAEIEADGCWTAYCSGTAFGFGSEYERAMFLAQFPAAVAA